MSDLITYDDKIRLKSQNVSDKYKVTAEDMNEIKRTVNANVEIVDEINNPENWVSVGTEEPTDGERVWFKKGKNLLSLNRAQVTYSAGIVLNESNMYSNMAYDGGVGTSNTQNVVDGETLKVTSRYSQGVGFPIKCNPNEEYTLTLSNTNSLGSVCILFFGENNTYLSNSGNSHIETLSVTTPSNCKWLVVLFDVTGGTKTEVSFSNIQLEEGSTATSYEPYEEKSIKVDNEDFISMSDLVSVGVNQPSDGKRVWFAKSKNLLPQNQYVSSTTINGIIFTNNGDGTFNLSGTATANTTIMIMPANIINLEANQPYYLYSSTPYDVNTFNLSIAMTDNSTSKFIIANNTYTPTATPTNVRLQFYIGSGKSVNATNVKLMLVKGSTAPGEYEPYVEEGIYVDNENWLFDNYSTSEQVIGKWIDGKNLYRKCYSAGALKNNGQIEISLNISNFNKLVKMYGVSYSSGYTMILPFVHGNASSIVNMYFNNTSKAVGIETHSDRTSYTETYVVVEYTKTTD